MTWGIKGLELISASFFHRREEFESMMVARLITFSKSPNRRKIRDAFGAICMPAPISPSSGACSRTRTSWPLRFRPGGCHHESSAFSENLFLPMAVTRPAIPAPTIITRNVLLGFKIHALPSSSHSILDLAIQKKAKKRVDRLPTLSFPTILLE